MTMLSYGIAFILVCIACYTDIKKYEISNRLSLLTWIIGLTINVFQFNLRILGWTLLCAIIIFGILLLLYIVKGMGAGDVKFLSGLTFLLGVKAIWILLILAFVIAGILALLIYIVQGLNKILESKAIKEMRKNFRFHFIFHNNFITIVQIKQIPFMIAVFPAYLLTCYLEVMA